MYLINKADMDSLTILLQHLFRWAKDFEGERKQEISHQINNLLKVLNRHKSL